MSRFFTHHALFALLLAIILMMNTGGILSAGMMAGDDGMTHCPYMGVAALCNMTPLEHAAEWQQLFATTVQQFATTILLLLLTLAIAWYFVGKFVVPKHTKAYVPRYRYRERIFDPLQLAFARGIIHTKVF